MADEILKIKNLSHQEYEEYSKNALETVKEFDFENLTGKLVNVIEKLT